MAASDRAEVGQATDTFDRQLRLDLLAFGEQRNGNLRIGFVRPLAVLFEVYPDDMRVDVVAIKRISRPSE